MHGTDGDESDDTFNITANGMDAKLSETQTFAYDPLDRLTSANATGNPLSAYNESYGYNGTTGNLETKAGVSLTYNASVSCAGGTRTIPHAVSSAGGNTYAYDCNGNQTTRVIGADTFTLKYDAENRLIEVKKSTGGGTPTMVATFVYDGDGRQVRSTVNGQQTTFVGPHYEVKDSVVSKYYFAGAQRIAFRTNGTLSYVTGDHLGSTSLTTDANGNLVSELRYKPWGETRYVNGATQTDYKYTGQREEASLGLYFYNARWYDPALGRFAQADTIVAKGVQGLDRYAYVNNSPIRYADPSGHDPSDCVSHVATEKCQPPPPVLVILACGVDSTNDDCGADDQPLNGYDSWGTGHGYQVSRFGADTYGNEVGAVERYARAILAAMMAFLNENPTGKIYLIGHSRGGAAVAWALNLYLYEVGGDPSRIAKVVFIEPTVNTTDPKRKDDYAAYDTVLKNFDTHFYMSTSYDPAGPDGDLTTPDDDLNGLYSPLTVTIVQTSAICFIWCYPASPHMLMATEGNVTDLIMASFLTEPAHDYGRRR